MTSGTTQKSLTPFERDLVELGVPPGSAFTLEYRFNVWDWLGVAALTRQQLDEVPGLDQGIVARVLEAARARRERWTDGRGG